MTIQTTKELESLLKMLRKQGVYEATIDSMTFKLGVLPGKPSKQDEADLFPEAKLAVPKYNGDTPTEPDTIETDGLTDEQRLFYSSKEEPGVEQ